MVVFESQRSRRLVVRLDRGERLHEALERVARDHAVTTGHVRVTGVLAWASIDAYDAGARERSGERRIVGPLELASASGFVASAGGSLRVDLHAVLGRGDDHGLVMIAGHLADAEVLAAEAFVECLDDLGLRRENDETTGLAPFRGEGRARGLDARTPEARPVRPDPTVEVRPARAELARAEAPRVEPARAEPKPAPSPAAASWAAVAAASQSDAARAPAAKPIAPAFVEDPIADKRRDEVEEEHMPSQGDWVDHRQFGLCRVDRVGEDGELLLRLETGRRKAIKLDFLDVLAPRMDGPRRIFPLRPKKR